MTQLWKLPIICVCENNLYNEYTHRNVPIPFSPTLEDLSIPTAEVVCETVKTPYGKV